MNISSTTSTERTNETSQTLQQSEREENNKQSFSDEYKMLLAQNGFNLGVSDQNMLLSIINSNKTNKSDFLGYASSLSSIRSAFNYDTMTISKEDAEFFSELVEKTDYIVNGQNDASSFQATLLKAVETSNGQSLKTTEVSKALMNLIESAYQTGKPTRIDFDNNVSVILKISKDGKLSAEFIPGDKAVEEYLRNNIGYLKETLDNKNIDYGDIMYKPYKNGGGKQRQNQQNGQNNNGGQQ